MSGNDCALSSVKKLQSNLNSKSVAPLLPLVVDGKFGQATADRLDRVYKIKQVSSNFFKKL
jgi:hypothetical protein